MSEVKQAPEYLADLELLERMFGEGFDWEAWHGEHGGDEPEEVFGRVYKWHDYRKGDRSTETVNCGGHEFPDTPRALYRALHLLEPAEVDFSDMYKTGSLVDFCAPDFEFHCSFQLHKHEACIRFYCAPQHVVEDPDRGRGGLIVQGGWASCDNGVYCKSELGNKWFAIVVQAIERKWMVYSGNEFSV